MAVSILHPRPPRLAKDEGVDAATLHIHELASLLLGIADWKYSDSESAGAEEASRFLRSIGVGHRARRSRDQ